MTRNTAFDKAEIATYARHYDPRDLFWDIKNRL